MSEKPTMREALRNMVSLARPMTLDLATLEASLKRDEELAAKATPGPWHVDKYDVYIWGPEGQMVADNPDHVQREAIIRARGVGAGLPIADNMAFIAHARTALFARVQDCRELFFALEHSEAAAEGHKTDAEFWEHNFREQQAKTAAAERALAEAVRALERALADEHDSDCGLHDAPAGAARRCDCSIRAALSSLQPRKDTP